MIGQLAGSQVIQSEGVAAIRAAIQVMEHAVEKQEQEEEEARQEKAAEEEW